MFVGVDSIRLFFVLSSFDMFMKVNEFKFLD